MFLSFKSFLIFFLTMFILIMIGICCEETLIRFEQGVLRFFAKRHRNRAHVHALRAERQTKIANQLDR